MLIRRPTVADAEAIADLHLDVWDEAYADLMAREVLVARRAARAQRIETWRASLADGLWEQWVADDDGRLVGFATAGGGRDEPEPGLPRRELMSLYVRASVYGAGVGPALFDAALGDAAAYLWVLDGNERAIRFYRGRGFAFDGRTTVAPFGRERRMVRPAA
ncbi:GNAT family N-acetyltransferase [Xylanimonas ulmi]|uniref:L-amino acid N-acyltransferase YncA n=1 Tax=Xylanimonas ulmi TaxID=228973 RepID=A0A4Q7M721_9MICO|nr:GNAT family N-acetyltransferase [Xylanibacterium ulmi]RZS61899.1 L-amino acid N-acyltransferase YncA [Xylanibacterium ulmi]